MGERSPQRCTCLLAVGGIHGLWILTRRLWHLFGYRIRHKTLGLVEQEIHAVSAKGEAAHVEHDVLPVFQRYDAEQSGTIDAESSTHDTPAGRDLGLSTDTGQLAGRRSARQVAIGAARLFSNTILVARKRLRACGPPHRTLYTDGGPQSSPDAGTIRHPGLTDTFSRA